MTKVAILIENTDNEVAFGRITNPSELLTQNNVFSLHTPFNNLTRLFSAIYKRTVSNTTYSLLICDSVQNKFRYDCTLSSDIREIWDNDDEYTRAGELHQRPELFFDFMRLGQFFSFQNIINRNDELILPRWHGALTDITQIAVFKLTKIPDEIHTIYKPANFTDTGWSNEIGHHLLTKRLSYQQKTVMRNALSRLREATGKEKIVYAPVDAYFDTALPIVQDDASLNWLYFISKTPCVTQGTCYLDLINNNNERLRWSVGDISSYVETTINTQGITDLTGGVSVSFIHYTAERPNSMIWCVATSGRTTHLDELFDFLCLLISRNPTLHERITRINEALAELNGARWREIYVQTQESTIAPIRRNAEEYSQQIMRLNGSLEIAEREYRNALTLINTTRSSEDITSQATAIWDELIVHPNILNIDVDAQVNIFTRILHVKDDRTGLFHELGAFRIQFKVRNISESLLISNLTRVIMDAYWAHGSASPHVGQDRAGCLGTVSSSIKQCSVRGDIVGVVEILLMYLQTANIHDVAGEEVNKWPLSHGTYEDTGLTFNNGVPINAN